MCNKAALMTKGQVVATGPVDEVLKLYHQSIAEPSSLTAGNIQELASIA
jgi:ABC-type polysaccharide/polyol phosphate transport system ATPase subunit